MKTKLFLIATAMFVYSHNIAQPDANIPTIVKENFKKQYPTVKDVDWEKENGEYEAEFEIDNVDHTAVYNAAGNLVKTEVEIPPSTLPKATLVYLAKNANGQKVKEVTRLTNINGDVMYEVELENSEFLFEVNGTFIKQKIRFEKDR